MACVTQQSRPRLLFGVRIASDVARDFGIGPHRPAVDEIFEAMAAEL